MNYIVYFSDFSVREVTGYANTSITIYRRKEKHYINELFICETIRTRQYRLSMISMLLGRGLEN